MTWTKIYPDVPTYKPFEVASKVAVAGDATNNYIEFTMNRPVTFAIAQVRTATTGAINVTGLAVTITTTAGSTPSCKVKVAVTSLGVGDTVDLIAF